MASFAMNAATRSLLLLLGCLGPLSAQEVLAANWPQFRGEGGLGIAAGKEPPVHFGATSNLLWKITLPSGNSSPCIWGDRLFLTSFDRIKLETLCLRRSTGDILWRQAAPPTEFEHTHRLGNPATPTPCTDGVQVFVSFGSFGLLAYDMDGAPTWKHPLPTPAVEFGTSSSPILAGDLLILICDQDDHSYLLAVHKKTGETAWRVERPQFRRSFSSPFLWRHQGQEELVVPGSLWLKSYRPTDGKELWSYTGTSRVANCTPVAEEDVLIYSSWNLGADAGSRISMPSATEFFPENDKNADGKLASAEIPAGPVRERFSQMDVNRDGFVVPEEWEMMRDMFAKANNAVIALKAGAKGNVSEGQLAWSTGRSLPYVSSPLAYQGRVYTMKNGGLASCYELRTGKVFYQDERVGTVGDYYSSAVATGNKIYLGSQSGTVLVLQAGETLQVLARNDLGEPIMATPAIADGVLFVRAGETLFALGRR